MGKYIFFTDIMYFYHENDVFHFQSKLVAFVTREVLSNIQHYSIILLFWSFLGLYINS